MSSTWLGVKNLGGLAFVLTLGFGGAGCKVLIQSDAGTEVARMGSAGDDSSSSGGGGSSGDGSTSGEVQLDGGGSVAVLASGSGPVSGGSGNIPKGYVSLGEKLRSDPTGLTYGFWRDVRSGCSVGGSKMLRGDGSGMSVNSAQHGYFVKFPMVYQAQVSFASEDCSGEPILSSFDYNQQVLVEGITGNPAWFGKEGFGAPDQMTFFKDLPDYMIAAMIKDGNGNLMVNMMSLFHDPQGELHLSLFANSRPDSYFSENGIPAEFLGKWPGKDDSKFQNAFDNPLWYMDLMKVDLSGGAAAQPAKALAPAKRAK